MKKFKVGVIGNGFVGESQAFAFSPTCEIKIFDKKKISSFTPLKLGFVLIFAFGIWMITIYYFHLNDRV